MKFLKHKRRESHISITNELTKLPKEPLNSLYDNKTYTKLTSLNTPKRNHPSIGHPQSKQVNRTPNQMRDDPVQPHRKATIEVNTLLIRIRENRYSIHQLQLRGWDLPYHCHKPRHMHLVIHQLQKVKVSSILKLFCWMKYTTGK